MAHAKACLPDEACGLLAGDVGGGRLEMAYPLDNADPAPDRFTIDPAQHFGAVRHAERSGWEVMGVFHSHPRGGHGLSATDLSQPHESAWIHVVVGFVPRRRLGVWRIVSGGAVAVEWDSV